MNLSLHTFESPLGTLLLAGDEQGRLRALDFSATRLHRRLGEQYGRYALTDGTQPHPAEVLLARYFDGDLDALRAIDVAAAGSELEEQVWSALRGIPAGQTTHYGELARRLGHDDPRIARDVGTANARNPIAIVVPCHRVIGKDGSLKGYAWGLARKRWLLAHEGVPGTPGDAPQLPGL
jgi:methylated-DNA-[protein]-cysteine S-methyltransferase